MNRILHQLWLWIWHLLPGNPILVRVVYGASRRQRHLWLRVGYLTALLLVVVFSLIYSASGQSASLAELAKGASQTFKLASMTQLALMCFLAPVFTASAITQERDAQTFNILLSTPLSNAQIVFGSLISRLYFVIMLLIAGLPIFLMTMIYGGVTTSRVVESFALSCSTAVLTGAIAIFIAMIGVGTRRTIFSFYLMIALYLISLYLLGVWNRTWVDLSPANVDGRRMSWLTAVHPFLALDVALNSVHAVPYSRLGDYSRIARYALAYPSAVYVAWTTTLALVLTVSSMFFVRRGAKTGEQTFFTKVFGRFRRSSNDDRTRPPRTVWNNPVAWRESRSQFSGGGILRLALIAGGFAAPMALFIAHITDSFSAAESARWLAAMITVQFALALILAINAAATSITKEKESRSMDLLLSTPLTSKYILWGKLRGLVSFAMPLLVGPILVLLLFGAHAWYRGDTPPLVWIEATLELGVLMAIYTALACVVGLWRSLSARRNVTAVMHSVAFMIILFGVLSIAGFAIVKASGGEFGAFVAPATPFTLVRFLVDPGALFDSSAEFSRRSLGARTAALFGSAIAAAAYIAVVWRSYAFLVRNFDMTLRKQSGQ